MPRPGGAVTGRRLGPGAAPLSAARAPGALPGRPRPCRRRRWPPGRPSPGATREATARREWSSWSRPDHRLAPAGQDVLGGVEPPAGVGGGVDEPAPRRPRSLGRFGPGHPLPTEDPGQPRRRGRLQAHGGHLVVHADRTVVQSRALQSRAHIEGPGANPIGQAARAGARTARPGLEHRRGPLLQRAPAQDVERLAPDALLGAERRHRPTGRVIGPPGDRQTDTGINTAVLIGAHPSIPNHECHHQDPPNRHRCPDTEPSPMS